LDLGVLRRGLCQQSARLLAQVQVEERTNVRTLGCDSLARLYGTDELGDDVSADFAGTDPGASSWLRNSSKSVQVKC
jgi:hypothetical protein